MMTREKITEREYAPEKHDALALLMFASGLFGMTCAVFPRFGAAVVEIVQIVIWRVTG